MRTEPSRRHGAFDRRYPRLAPRPPSRWPLDHPDDGTPKLAWPAFAARFFPGQPRHDSQALAAYEAYGNRIDARAQDASAAP